MNNVFSFQRFGKYFLYDLLRSRGRYGLSLVITGLVPVIGFSFIQLFTLIINGHWMPDYETARYVALFIALAATVLIAPAKMYGDITDKRSGSDWLMIPASTFEKWLSMAIMVCIVLPILLCLLLFVSDTIVALLFPATYGSILGPSTFKDITDSLSEGGIDISLSGIFLFNWAETVLAFTLGALVFKKSKVGKTILCCFLFSMLFGVLFSTGILPEGWAEGMFDSSNLDPATFISNINVAVNIIYWVVICALLGSMYFRLRTIKH